MALEGELKGLEGTTCSFCDRRLDLSVCRSGAGYYLGYFCLNCGPYSRETGYWDTKEEAHQALAGRRSRRIRDTEFHK
jgi:hypothetical protein